MPSLLSHSAAATVSKARRRERRVTNRARPPVQFPNTLLGRTSTGKRSSRHRRTRDRESFDVDDCFNICQDQGFHRDPDVRLGSNIRADVNQFAILAQDTSCPSSPLNLSQHGFTFAYPSPCFSSPLGSNLSAAEPLASPILPPNSKLLLRRCRSPSEISVGCPIVPLSPLLPSMPTTPWAKPRVRLPVSCSAPTSLPSPVRVEESNARYLDGIKIPSPLLYHKRSRELLESSSDDDINEEVARTFLLTCGRDLPSPDFESYKLFDDNATDRIAEQTDKSLETATLPYMGQDLRTSKSFCNIPQLPWLEQSASGSSIVKPPAIMTTTNSISYPLSARSRSDSGATIIGPKRSISQARISSVIGSGSTELVFPRLSIPTHCLDILDRTQSGGLGDALPTRPTFIDDDPVTVFKMWTAFDDAIQNPRAIGYPSEAFQYETGSPLGKLPQSTTPKARSLIRPQPEAKVAACPTSTCMALVPARLYEHQYLGWPDRVLRRPEYQATSYPILRASLNGELDVNRVLKMAKWLEELGFDRQHVPKCPVAADINSSFDEDFKVTLDEDPSGSTGAADSAETAPSHASTGASADDVGDEGYFTCQESGSEIDAEEAVLSEDEWAEWDWEAEEATEEESVDVDVFGIGWGF